MTKPRPPKGLGTEGRKLWRAYADTYSFDPREDRVLLDAARTADVISRLEAELDGAELVVKGSQGQSVPHPMIPELRQYRATLASLLKQIELPDQNAAPINATHAARAMNAKRHAR